MSFDRIAPFYQLLEYLVFGKALQRRRCAFLADIQGCEKVWVLGDGDGRFTASLIMSWQTNRKVRRVRYVDSSRRMISLAKRRLKLMDEPTASVSFCQGDVLDLPLTDTYDLVVSHFFLDCFCDDQLATLVPKIASRAESQAAWLISEFAIPSQGWRRLAAMAAIACMYFFFRVAADIRPGRLPEYRIYLQKSGLQLAKRQSAFGGFLVSELWVFSGKSQGADTRA